MHILGVTSLLIASKYEEIYPPELKDLLSVSENKFNRQEVLAMEQDMLQVLQFNITTPSILRFLERIRKICSITDDQTFFFAQYIAEISLLDASLLKYRSSEIAAAAILLSTKQLKKVNIWTKDVVKMTGIEEEPL